MRKFKKLDTSCLENRTRESSELKLQPDQKVNNVIHANLIK